MIVKPQDAWDLAYSQLELQLDRANFDTWLRGAVLLGVESGVYVIGVKNTYAREMLQQRLYRNVRRVLMDVLEEPVELRFEVYKASTTPENPASSEMPLFRLLAQQQMNQELDQQTRPTLFDAPFSQGLNSPSLMPPSSDSNAPHDGVPHNGNGNGAPHNGAPLHTFVRRPEYPDLPESELNPRFTFDRFVVSNANRMAYEAARAVAENPGRNYNPFFVYGGVGLGKTHLLQAVAQYCKQKGLRVIYVPSEAFTNDMVTAIRQRTMAMFREKYRSADVLLVDDVQFISGKDGTQEEFFHTFNALYTFQKQIVLASDRHPRELTTLEDRLRSRFEGGLIMDIPPLEYEMRVAILQMWAQERHVRLPYSMIEMIANRVQSNVRELEGAFTQVVAKAQFGQRPLTMTDAETALVRFEAPRTHGKKMNIDDIIHQTALYYRMKDSAIKGKGRTQLVNQARQVAMFLARELTELSLPQIGESFGGRSHTTVLHGCNKVIELMEFDHLLSKHVQEIRRALTGD